MKRLFLLFIILIAISSCMQEFKQIPTQRFPDMHIPRQEIAGVELNDKFYIIGGIDVNRKSSDAVEVYNPKNNSWQGIENLPNKIHHVGAVVYENKIYVIGGFETKDDKFIPVDSVYVFDGQKWTIKSKMPHARGGLGVILLDEKIYAIGGADSKKSLSIVEVYDPIQDKWEEHSYMNFARDHLAVAKVNEKIYAIGGRESSNWPFSNKAEIEMFEDGKWRLLDIKIEPRSGMAYSTLNNKVYLFGGESSINVFEEFEILENNKITKIKTQLTPRHGFAAIPYRIKYIL